MNEHLDGGNAELNESEFTRMFALGCFDSLIVLPISIAGVVSNIITTGPRFSFYQGWARIHSNWEPVQLSKSLWSSSKWSITSVYWNTWINAFYALVFFALFGLSPGARKAYRRLFRFIGKPFGVRQVDQAEVALPEPTFESVRGTNTTVTSNVSSRYGLSILSARKYLLAPYIT